MLDRLRLTTRVLGSAGLLWALLAAVMWIAYTGLGDARSALKSVEGRLAAANRVAHIADAVRDDRLGLLLAFQHDPSGALAKLHDHPLATHLEQVAANRAAVDREWATYLAGLELAEERTLSAAAEQALNAWRLKVDHVVSAIASGAFGPEEMQTLLVAGRTEGVQAVKALETLKRFQEARASEASTAAEVRFHRALTLFAVVLVFGLLPSVLFTVLALKRLGRGLEQAQAAAHAIAAGELGRSVEVSGADEVTRLLEEMAAMRKGLEGVIQEVRAGAAHVASASTQVASGTEDLASRTERQAAAVQQTVAAIAQLDTAVKQNADHASSADAQALAASTTATEGSEAMGAVVDTMEEIKGASKRIEEITSVIDEIAFQTNILALNASVEAARAGEHGRGFAVVATEVGALAKRTGESARQIKTLIDDSVRRVSSGVEKVSSAGERMRAVVESIRGVTSLVNEISASSQEQTRGLTQIRQAVTSMDTDSQQNAALVQQTSAATASLSSQAQQLSAMVGRFRLADRRS